MKWKVQGKITTLEAGRCSVVPVRCIVDAASFKAAWAQVKAAHTAYNETDLEAEVVDD